MQYRSRFAILAIAAAWPAMSMLATAQDEPVKDTLIEQAVTLPDASIVTLMRTIEWPVGYRSAEHSHRGPGPRYVLAGTVEITQDGRSERHSAGNTFWYDPRSPHTAENVGSVPAKVLIVELLPPE